MVENAIKYTNKGEISVKIDCLNKNQFKTRILIEISDTGIGIPVYEQENIFKSFYRGSSKFSQEQGVGLGLAIVKRIVHLLQGKINLVSDEGIGTTFQVTLDMKNVIDQKPIPTMSVETAILENKKILVTDDIEDNQILIKHYFV